MTKPARQVTLSEIARLAGVSRQVVSAVVRPDKPGSVRFSEETRKRVLDVLKKVNWRPNRTALNLSRKRHGSVGILIRNMGCIPDQVLRFMLVAAHDAHEVLMLDYIDEESDQRSVFIREDSVDAVILFEDVSPALDDAIASAAVPCVRVNTSMRSGPGCITYDEEGAMALATAHLKERGKNRALLLHGEPAGYWVEARKRGMIDGAAACGMAEPVLYEFTPEFWNPAKYDAIIAELHGIFETHPDLDCVVTTHDKIVPHLYHAIGQLGRKIPEDIAVVTMYTSGVATTLKPQLTSVRLDGEKLGRYVMQIANAGIDGKAEFESPQLFQYALHIRESS